MKYSLVIPVFNEAESISQLHQEIVETMSAIGDLYEIIFVNDGSIDGTQKQLEALAPVTVIQFRRNFGQTAAMDAGIKYATGEYVITMDGDGQNPPAEIPKLIATMQAERLDVVSGWRADRKDPFLKRFISRGANVLRKKLINDGIHDSGCSLKIYRRECFDLLDLYGEMHRFIPAMLRMKGFTIGEVKVAHRPRMHGTTHYNWKRTIKGLLDMIGVWFLKKYAARPLHLFGGFGFLLLFLSGIAGAGVLYGKLFNNVDLSDTALTEITFFLLLIGIVLIAFGLIADMLSKLYFSTTKDEPYAVHTIVTHT